MSPYRSTSQCFKRLGPLVTCGLLLAGGFTLAQPDTAHAASAKNFNGFCQSWMGKLAERERNNLSQVKFREHGDGVLAEYTGYSDKPVRCETTATGVKANPFVGKLVYYELLYRRAGRTPKEARTSQPQVLRRVEVLELFRFDGTRWVY